MRRSFRVCAVVVVPSIGLALVGLAGAQTMGGGVGGASSTSSIAAPITSGSAVEIKLPLKPGGLTADGAAQRAVKTSKTAKVDEAKLKVAAAQVDQAWDAYLPKVTAVGRYTRLSPVEYGPLAFGGQSFPNPFPVILNSYLVQGSVSIPLSDYVFRIYQQHESALKGEEAAKLNAQATTLQVAGDTRVAYYQWVRALGAVIVAKQRLVESEAHLKDQKAQLALKATTTADVYRFEAGTANAQLGVIQAENLVTVSEAYLRMWMHAGDEESLDLGEDIDVELPPSTYDLKALKAEALSKRPELKAIDSQIDASNLQGKVADAGMFPRLDAFGNLYYARPNPRFVPQVDEFKFTWDVGLQLSWSPNDFIVASDQKKQANANTELLKATKDQMVDQLTMDVITAYSHLREMEASLVAASVGLRASEEAYRVRLEQFHGGAATSTEVIDAEGDLTRARLNYVYARVDLRIARARVKRVVGEP